MGCFIMDPIIQCGILKTLMRSVIDVLSWLFFLCAVT